MTAFYQTKGWWASKTVWTGIVAAVLGVLSLFGFVLPVGVSPDTVVSILLVIAGVLATVFRINATDAVAVLPSNTTK